MSLEIFQGDVVGIDADGELWPARHWRSAKMIAIGIIADGGSMKNLLF